MRKPLYYIYLLILVFVANSANANNKTTTTLEALKRQINLLQKKVELLEKEQKAKAAAASTIKNLDVSENNNALKFYATLRPTFGYIEDGNEKSTDVRDALSHAGFKATNTFADDWSAILHAEWGIDLSNNGDFGKARQVYVALDSPFGTVGIGKQRQPQYLFIAEYVDIFNHSNSPFAYDPESIFFVDNLVTYKVNTGNLTWMLASQFDGDEGSNYSDLTNFGISYDNKGLHTAFTYLTQDSQLGKEKNGEDEVFAGSIAYQFTEKFYLALSYQQRAYQRYSEVKERDGHTFDFSASYQLSDSYKLKVGLFDFSDGHELMLSHDFNGFNTTLEWLPSPSLRFHLEYLQRDFEYLDDFSSISVGFRYDFSIETHY